MARELAIPCNGGSFQRIGDSLVVVLVFALGISCPSGGLHPSVTLLMGLHGPVCNNTDCVFHAIGVLGSAAARNRATARLRNLDGYLAGRHLVLGSGWSGSGSVDVGLFN